MLAFCACADAKTHGAATDAATVDTQTTDANTGGHDGMPEGAIEFFLATACPAGWNMFHGADGRTIVPVGGADEGTAVGVALAANEERAHHHPLDVQVDLGSVSFAGIAGEANHGIANGGAVDATAATDDGVAGLPYAQLLVCQKAEPAAATPPPAHAIAFFDAASCPGGWHDDVALHGRVLVSLPQGGTPGATFGGTPLAPGETRTHVHAVTATVSSGSHAIALASGCCAGGYGGAGDHAATASATPASVDLPYLQLLACVSN